MIFAAANTDTEIRSAAVRPMLGTSAGLGLRTGMAQCPTQGGAGYADIARADWGKLLGGAIYK